MVLPIKQRTYESGKVLHFVIKDGLAYKVLADLGKFSNAEDFFRNLVYSAPDATSTNKETGEVFTNRWCTVRSYEEQDFSFS